MTDQTAHGAVKQRHREAADDLIDNADLSTLNRYEQYVAQAFARFEASLSPTTTDAVRGEVEPVAWQFQLAHSRDVNGEYFGWGPMRVAFEKPCVPEGSIRKLQPLYSATLHPSPEDPIGGQDVEAVAKIIHDECEDDDDSCGGAYMRAAKRILAALRAPVERKGEG